MLLSFFTNLAVQIKKSNNTFKIAIKIIPSTRYRPLFPSCWANQFTCGYMQK